MSEIERHEQEIRMIRTLLGNDKRLWELYDTSAEFHGGVQMLARTLPAFVKVMAQEAESAVARREALVDELKRRPPTVDPDPLKGWGYDYKD